MAGSVPIPKASLSARTNLPWLTKGKCDKEGYSSEYQRARKKLLARYVKQIVSILNAYIPKTQRNSVKNKPASYRIMCMQSTCALSVHCTQGALSAH